MKGNGKTIFILGIVTGVLLAFTLFGGVMLCLSMGGIL